MFLHHEHVLILNLSASDAVERLKVKYLREAARLYFMLVCQTNGRCYAVEIQIEIRV